MAAPSFVSVATAGVASNSTVVAPGISSGLEPGDLAIIYNAYRTELRGTAIPAGWADLVDWNPQHHFFGREVTGTSVANTSVFMAAGSGGGGGTHFAQMAAFRGVDLSALDSLVFTASSGIGPDVVVPSVQGSSNSLLVIAVHRADDGVATFPDEFTQIGQGSSTIGDDAMLAWACRELTSGGPTGEVFVDISGTSTQAVYSAALVLPGIGGGEPVPSLVGATVTLWDGDEEVPLTYAGVWNGSGLDAISLTFEGQA